MAALLLQHERDTVAAVSRALAADDLVAGTSGNVSARNGDQVAITPTGAVLAELEAADVTVIDMAGNVVDGDLAPTSELDLHLGVYDRYGAGGVVHAHAPIATALSCVLDEVPVVHYEMLRLGGAVPVAPYETFGTPELAAAVLDALEGKAAVLMANHGVVTHGADVEQAAELTRLLEWACSVYWHAAAIGKPRVLDEAAQQAVVEAAVRRRYGATQDAQP